MRKPMTMRAFGLLRSKRQMNVLDLVNALHEAGFSTLFVESVCIGREDYYMRVFIGQKDLGYDQMAKLEAAAHQCGAKVSLADHYELGTRLAVWPNNG